VRFPWKPSKRPGQLDRGDVAVLAAANKPAKPKPSWPDEPVRCPRCGGSNIYWSLTCHTYATGDGEDERWKSCLPCDSAVHYGCADEACNWDYTHGLNPGNPRSAVNEKHRPPWLPETLSFSEHGFPQIRPRVREIGDDDD
jgi:hypothetical protein